ncbi:MAG: hypothetical protein GY754_26490 [bacterium]|nr:hypothetical protein [bacterium]
MSQTNQPAIPEIYSKFPEFIPWSGARSLSGAEVSDADFAEKDPVA